MTEPRYTALRKRHEEHGASFTDFGGWMMPVRYTSDLAEHTAVRERAGLFDISHMAEFLIHGEGDAAGYLDYALAGKISTMKIGKAKYSLLLDENGGIIDDVIVYRTGETYFLVISNAGNRDAVAAAFTERLAAWKAIDVAPARSGEGNVAAVAGASTQVDVTDMTDNFSLIAVQGPVAREILEQTPELAVTGVSLEELPYYAWTTASYNDQDVVIARTGYTGEDGFELLVRNSDSIELWNDLLRAGEPLGLQPAGLAARDTLRLEAGMPLYGHELSLDIVPAQAGLGRVVGADKGDFVGAAALATRDTAAAPVLVGLVAEGRRAGRADYDVYSGDEKVGTITSGALSPTLGYPIAMAFVSPAVSAEGTVLDIDVRGTRIPATVTALPFYRRKK